MCVEVIVCFISVVFLRHSVVYIQCVSKNDTYVAHYNFNPHQLILANLAEMFAKRVHCRKTKLKHTVICMRLIIITFKEKS